MSRSILFFIQACALWGLVAPTATRGDEPAATPEQIDFFEKQVRPLLVEHCYQCHSVQAKRVEANLLLDSRKGHVLGGDSGPTIVPGDADDSLLIEAVRYESYEMPPKGKLPDNDIETLVRWVNMGAPWPEDVAPTADMTREEFDLAQRKADFWVWQPISNVHSPEIKNDAWPRNEIDRHILARLEQAGLNPAEDADQTALLRRLYFDLIGLPPTPEEVEEFRYQSIERVVDRLLGSPHFGERWGRHWLDLVRYAESRGHEFDNDTPNAFQYRDYVIRALNSDVPYDQFVREHIAGDLLPEPRLHPQEQFNESVLGTGFWFLGEWVHSPVDIRKDESDRFDNMLDVMSKTFLGVTVACARCHDHKFDAISTADYYSLSGFLQSSDYRQVRFESMEQNRRVAEQLASLDAKYQRQIIELLESQGLRLPTQTSYLSDEAIVVDYGRIPQSEYLQDGYIFGQSPRREGLPYLEMVEPATTRSTTSRRRQRKPRAATPDQIATEDSADEAQPVQSDEEVPLDGEAEDRSRQRLAVKQAWRKVSVARFGAAVSDSIWSGLESITEGAVQNRSEVAKLPKSGRTLRSPTFELQHGKVGCLVNGTGHIVACVDSHRLVAGPLHKETIREINSNERWVTLDLDRYIGHRLHLEFIPAEDTQLSVRMVTQGLDENGLADLDQRLVARDRQYEEYAQASEVILNANSLNGKLQAPAAENESTNDKQPSTGASGLPLSVSRNSAGARADEILLAWQQEREQLATQIVRKSRVAPAMLDGTGEDDHILIRGNSSKPGEVEPRHFLTAVSGNSPMSIKTGSGRLELAEQINDPANPLTSRVIVNRIWHHLMGRGIVPTVDDFGYLGQRPSHPELLDHLATRFNADGRSIKRMIKYIVLSRTYQMSSQASPSAVETDPNNLLWHHQPPRRLQGEVIRDSLLALSGRLDRQAFGPPVPIHLTSFMDGRGRPENSGPLDGEGRRSIYIAVRRNFLSPFMLTFDTPVPFSSMGRRNVSNVPAQALILLNDPLVVELSGEWGERALQSVAGEGHAATKERIDWMYLSAFGRHPTNQESEAAVAFLETQATKQKLPPEAPELWASFAHVLVNTKEFIFLR